jgi:hypothetical protein
MLLVIANVIHWLARILGGALFLFFMAFIIGEGPPEKILFLLAIG